MQRIFYKCYFQTNLWFILEIIINYYDFVTTRLPLPRPRLPRLRPHSRRPTLTSTVDNVKNQKLSQTKLWHFYVVFHQQMENLLTGVKAR